MCIFVSRHVKLGWFSLILFSSLALAQDCTQLWERLDSRPYEAKLFIDSDNTYWRLRLALPKEQKTALKLRALFPYSRYTSFNVYDQKTLDSSDFIADRSIKPTLGSENPFLNGVPRNVVNRSYEVLIVPHGKKNDFATTPNVLEFPPFKEGESEQFVEIWYRVYFPDRDSDENGSVALPQIESLSVEDLSSAKCPSRGVVPPPEFSIPNLPPRPTRGDVYFYHSRGSAIYSLPDNHYLVSRLTHRKSEVYVFRFLPPTFANTYFGGGVFDGNTQVRYWSVCIAGLDGTTGECLPDAKAKRASDGYINIVVGSEEMREEIEKKGFNFISRGNFFIPVVLYRNLLSAKDFTANLDQVPLWFSQPFKPAGLARPQAAHEYIGEYAPKGAFCSKREFWKNFCGVELSN